MPYNHHLSDHIQKLLSSHEHVEAKEMFGGIAFMVNGHMAIGVVKDELMVRVGKDMNDDALKKTGARIMDFTHKPMKGFIFVNADGYTNDGDLRSWVDMALSFNRTLKPKA